MLRANDWTLKEDKAKEKEIERWRKKKKKDDWWEMFVLDFFVCVFLFSEELSREKALVTGA